MQMRPKIQESVHASISGIESLAMVSMDDLVLKAVMEAPKGADFPWA